jgi:hypothetical protein
MGQNQRVGHLCVGKPPILALRIGMKTLEGSHWKNDLWPNAGLYLRLHSSISSTTLEMTRQICFPIQV